MESKTNRFEIEVRNVDSTDTWKEEYNLRISDIIMTPDKDAKKHFREMIKNFNKGTRADEPKRKLVKVRRFYLKEITKII